MSPPAPIPDVVNAIIYITLTGFVWLSIRRVLIDKEVKGVYWMTLGGLASRSCWNLYFYTFLGLWWSLIGVTFLACSEITYMILLYKYSRHFRRQIHDAIEAVQDKVEEVVEVVKDNLSKPPD